MSLIDDWKNCWRWISVNCMAAAMALQGAWLAIPDDLRDSLPRHFMSATTIALLILGLAGRLIKQKTRKKKPGGKR